jgi:hypothetical protein
VRQSGAAPGPDLTTRLLGPAVEDGQRLQSLAPVRA